MQPCTLFWYIMMESKTMRVAQRDLPTSTFQAIKLLESRKVSIIISIVGGNWE